MASLLRSQAGIALWARATFTSACEQQLPLGVAAPALQVRRILRRVTAPASKKEAKLTMKPLGRMLAKIMHSAPLAVAEQLIRQVRCCGAMRFGVVDVAQMGCHACSG